MLATTAKTLRWPGPQPALTTELPFGLVTRRESRGSTETLRHTRCSRLDDCSKGVHKKFQTSEGAAPPAGGQRRGGRGRVRLCLWGRREEAGAAPPDPRG